MDVSSSLFELAAAELRRTGIILQQRPGEYCVNVKSGSAATAYVTDDLADAIEHGRALAAALPSPEIPDPPESTRPKRRRRQPLRMTPKAIRRRMIRAHNHRLRARALKQQRDEN
jgi:hypothetical protein